MRGPHESSSLNVAQSLSFHAGIDDVRSFLSDRFLEVWRSRSPLLALLEKVVDGLYDANREWLRALVLKLPE